MVEQTKPSTSMVTRDYKWWRKEISTDLAPGTFGDNLTIAGLSSRDVSIGDRFSVLEMT